MKRQKYTYIPKDEIESINTWSGKNIPQDKILDGAYVRGNIKYCWGGQMADGGELPPSHVCINCSFMQVMKFLSYNGFNVVKVGDNRYNATKGIYNATEDRLKEFAIEYYKGKMSKMADGGETRQVERGKGYDVMVWETEEDRENGDSYRYDTFSDKEEAINIANRLYRRQDFACVEVIDRSALSAGEMKAHDSQYDETGVILHLCDDEYAEGGETEGMYTKSVEEQAQEIVGSRFYELNQQEREELINTLIKDGVIYPRVTYTQFEEEEFEYAKGGGVETASYKVVYQMVGSKDKKEKLFTDKTKAELFAETMEEDEDVKSVKLEEVKGKSTKASTPTINLFGAAKKAPATTGAKKSRPVVEAEELAEDIARHDQLKAIIENAKAELEVVDGRIEEVALEKYLEMYEDTGRNPPNFDLTAGGNSLIFIVMDKYIKVTPEKKELLEQYGEGLVEVVNTYEFNNAVIEKRVRGNKTVGDIISELIMKSTEIPAEDKANLITVKETVRVPKGTIDRLADYDSIPEVFTLIEPITALK